MAFYFERETGVYIFDEVVSSFRAATRKVASLRETADLQLIMPAPTTQGKNRLLATASFTIPLPAGYTNADRLYVVIYTNGQLKVSSTSPDHAASTILIKGSNTFAGVWSVTEHVTAITVTNVHATDACLLGWSIAWLPDLTSALSFRGLTSTGVVNK